MKKIIFISLFALALVSCGPALSDVKVGMTEAEVTEILGTANQTNSNSSSFTFEGGEESHSAATWKYDGLGTIDFVNGEVINISE
ncbi:MAG: hypothetical protein ACI857_002804 [Arenicella sp.]|jgi:hypothetical protein